jgi:hypothetical protein
VLGLRDGEEIVAGGETRLDRFDGFFEDTPADKVEPALPFLHKFEKAFVPDGLEKGIVIKGFRQVCGRRLVKRIAVGTPADTVERAVGLGGGAVVLLIESFGMDKKDVGIAENRVIDGGGILVFAGGKGSEVYVLGEARDEIDELLPVGGVGDGGDEGDLLAGIGIVIVIIEGDVGDEVGGLDIGKGLTECGGGEDVACSTDSTGLSVLKLSGEDVLNAVFGSRLEGVGEVGKEVKVVGGNDFGSFGGSSSILFLSEIDLSQEGFGGIGSSPSDIGAGIAVGEVFGVCEVVNDLLIYGVDGRSAGFKDRGFKGRGFVKHEGYVTPEAHGIEIKEGAEELGFTDEAKLEAFLAGDIGDIVNGDIGAVDTSVYLFPGEGDTVVGGIISGGGEGADVGIDGGGTGGMIVGGHIGEEVEVTPIERLLGSFLVSEGGIDGVDRGLGVGRRPEEPCGGDGINRFKVKVIASGKSQRKEKEDVLFHDISRIRIRK